MEKIKQNSALLVMDMQTAILSRLPENVQPVNQAKKAIEAARKLKIPVIYVVVGFRPGAPEISPNNKGFMTSKSMMTTANMDEWIKIHPDLAPASGEMTVVKRRVSAFTGSDLEVLLRAFSINHLILAGVATSGVILSTTREAADKDFALTILKDGCADGDEEVHRLLTTKVFPRQADVLSVEEWISQL